MTATPGPRTAAPQSHDAPAAGEFRQSCWDRQLADHVAARAVEWFAEDVGGESDWTSAALVDERARGDLHVVSRTAGVIAGLPAAGIVVRTADSGLAWEPLVADGTMVGPGTPIARLAGATRSVLTVERVVLNLLGRMSGVATATRLLVDAVAGTRCRVYDTRKTVPGWRLLDKYAVRMGGGWNHRMGLNDAILIKDNHLAALAAAGGGPAEAVRRTRAFVARVFPPARAAGMVVEIEVDSIGQLEQVLPEAPDIVLLDNMDNDRLAACVALRDRIRPAVVLEASGGVRPDTVGAIARTGVDRVSAGWPTHHAAWLDVALDWG
jgi:nicotinate-nucleotide pyrophosphorylase (carboxylating)